MKLARYFCASIAGLMLLASASFAEMPVKLLNTPALSPDGKTLAFAWRGDIWSVPSQGGNAVRLTFNAATDTDPAFSPDGKTIAFISNRDAGRQVYTMPSTGGEPKQLTFHTSGFDLEEWLPDGSGLLVKATRDYNWRRGERFFKISATKRSAPEMLFNDYGSVGRLSPDGTKLLFVREGFTWWRKGYKGSQAAQIWMYDLTAKTFTKVIDDPSGSNFPLWRPDGLAFYYVGERNKGACNVRMRTIASGEEKQLTNFEDDSAVFPAISRDGSTMVFRHLFDEYRLDLAAGSAPVKLDIIATGDATQPKSVERRVVSQATDVAFSHDGLQMAFVAGGDIWVMDTELKEPIQVTNTPEEEREPVFSPNDDSIAFISDAGGQTDVWKARRADATKYWWQNTKFHLEQLTKDDAAESNLEFSPSGNLISYCKTPGDLWISGADGKNARKIVESWSSPSYSWSPDDKWLAYSNSDNEFNADIWILKLDGNSKPFNLSRHPRNDFNPKWSPDGKIIAFVGQRGEREVDIHYVFLRREDDERLDRERTMEKALEKMKKGFTAPPKAAVPGAAAPATDPNAAPPGKGGGPRRRRTGDVAMMLQDPPGGRALKQDPTKPAQKTDGKSDGKTGRGPAVNTRKAPPDVVIDFDGIHDRIRRISIPDTSESALVWSPDSKKLAFSASIEGKPGIYTVEIPGNLRPQMFATPALSNPRWLETGGQIVGISGGQPASATQGGTPTTYRFQGRQTIDVPKRYRAIFDQCWQTMRDSYYDGHFGNHDWNVVRKKYAAAAEAAPDMEALSTIISLMLGELNGSHLGFRANPTGEFPAGAATWNVATAHFGTRFDDSFKGPGWKIADVIPKSPAWRGANRMEAGEVILAVDGVKVDPQMDSSEVLNGPLDRDFTLTVQGKDGKERTVRIRPFPFAAVGPLLYDKWVKDNRKKVEDASGGKLGYLHIAAMGPGNFAQFEADLFAAGAGKDGLVIDVRENGGGSIADYLLSSLTQPTHAITVPRGGGPGYPHDRIFFATWNKPIVVMCNQNSFSNAEIFSHAIKTLKRGKIVGVPSAGGVISTGAKQIMDVGTIRTPFRGWFLPGNGEDMELNGCVPDVVVWPQPGEAAAGKDTQLEKAVEVLSSEVAEWKSHPMPKLNRAMERK